MDLVACTECGFSANQATRVRCAVCAQPLGGGLPKPERRRRDPAATRAWRRDLLMRRGARPFTIPFGKTTRIGRGTECEVRVSSPRVSRVHAELWWEGQELHVRDLGSHNGTRVNESRVDDAILSDGDEVWIGPYRCTYRRLKGLNEEAMVRFDTELQALLSHEGAYEDDLAERDLMELLQALEVQKRSGTLTITQTDLDDGMIVVQGGRLVHASRGRLEGQEAVQSFLRCESGRLRFVQEVAGGIVENIRGDGLQSLLLDTAKEEDSMLTSKFTIADLLDLDEDAAPPDEEEEDDPNDETSPELNFGF